MVLMSPKMLSKWACTAGNDCDKWRSLLDLPTELQTIQSVKFNCTIVDGLSAVMTWWWHRRSRQRLCAIGYRRVQSGVRNLSGAPQTYRRPSGNPCPAPHPKSASHTCTCCLHEVQHVCSTLVMMKISADAAGGRMPVRLATHCKLVRSQFNLARAIDQAGTCTSANDRNGAQATTYCGMFSRL